MDIIFFYLIACIPLFVTGGFWFFSKKVIFIEALVLNVLGFLIAGMFHLAAGSGMTKDVQTLSGQITNAKKVSEWIESYQKEIYKTEYYYVTETRYRTVGTGKSIRTESYTVRVKKSREVFSHLEYRTRKHDEYFEGNDTFGRKISISKARYEDIVKKFGEYKPIPGDRSNSGYRERNNSFLSGDKNDYITINKNSYVYPVTDVKTWENKVKASPSIFSYPKIAEGIKEKLFEYPENSDIFSSNRLIGQYSWDIVSWDQMNSRLGPVKKVNVIAVNFGENSDQSISNYLESYWIGGKKNDLVITFGANSGNKPKWVRTFGWTEKEIVKRNIDSILLEKGITKSSLNLIEEEITKNYTIKDWTKFDYLTIEIPTAYFVICFIIIILMTLGWIAFSLLNGIDKDDPLTNHRTKYNSNKERAKNLWCI